MLVQFSPDGRRRLSIIRWSGPYTIRLEMRRGAPDDSTGTDHWRPHPTTGSFYDSVATAWRGAVTDHHWLTQELPSFHAGVPRIRAMPAPPEPQTAIGPLGWRDGWSTTLLLGSLAISCAVLWLFELLSSHGDFEFALRPLAVDIIVRPLYAWPVALIVSLLPITVYYSAARALPAKWRPLFACRLLAAIAVGVVIEASVLVAVGASWNALWSNGAASFFPTIAMPTACVAVAVVTRRRWLGVA